MNPAAVRATPGRDSSRSASEPIEKANSRRPVAATSDQPCAATTAMAALSDSRVSRTNAGATFLPLSAPAYGQKGPPACHALPGKYLPARLAHQRATSPRSSPDSPASDNSRCQENANNACAATSNNNDAPMPGQRSRDQEKSSDCHCPCRRYNTKPSTARPSTMPTRRKARLGSIRFHRAQQGVIFCNHGCPRELRGDEVAGLPSAGTKRLGIATQAIERLRPCQRIARLYQTAVAVFGNGVAQPLQVGDRNPATRPSRLHRNQPETFHIARHLQVGHQHEVAAFEQPGLARIGDRPRQKDL